MWVLNQVRFLISGDCSILVTKLHLPTAKDDVLPLNIQFEIISNNGRKYKIVKSKECSLMSQIDESAIYRTATKSESI